MASRPVSSSCAHVASPDRPTSHPSAWLRRIADAASAPRCCVTRRRDTLPTRATSSSAYPRSTPTRVVCTNVWDTNTSAPCRTISSTARPSSSCTSDWRGDSTIRVAHGALAMGGPPLGDRDRQLPRPRQHHRRRREHHARLRAHAAADGTRVQRLRAWLRTAHDPGRCARGSVGHAPHPDSRGGRVDGDHARPRDCRHRRVERARRAARTPRVALPARRRGASLRTRSFSLLTASYTLQGYVGYIFVFWFYLYLVQERKFTLLESAWWASLPWVLTIVSIPAGGWISDRLAAGRLGLAWGRRLVPLACLIAGGVMLAIGAATANPRVAALMLALSTASVLAVEGPFWATMLSVAGPRAGTAGGIMNMGSNVGGFISPALTPVLAAAIGWERSLDIAAVAAVMAGALWLGVKPGERP